jgi:adenylate cyclase
MHTRIVSIVGSPKKRHFLLGVGIAISIGAIFCLLFSADLMHSIQLRSNDVLFQTGSYHQASQTDKSIVVIGIDDKSLDQLGRFSSWPRSYYAKVVEILTAQRSRVIVFDILFSDPAPDDPALSLAMQTAGNVVLPVVQVKTSSGQTTAGSTAGAEYLLQPGSTLGQSVVALVHANVSADADGIVRRLPVVLDVAAEKKPALSLAAVSLYLRRPRILESAFDGDTLPLAGRVIPVNGTREMLINYSNAKFETLSFVDVLQGRADPGLLEDKIVLIGATASGMGDFFWTPMGHQMNGVEIHASAIRTILGDEFLKPASVSLTMMIILVMALLGGLAVMHFRVFWAGLSALLVCILYVLLAFYSFDHGTILNLPYPPVALAGTFLGSSLYKLSSEQSQKKAITRTFGRYVSAPVADNVLKALEDGKLDLQGKEQHVTVAFADIRGFTALSENTPAGELLNALNIHLSVVIDSVLKHNGMINKFGGDSLMAVWNAPVACQNHALLAVRAAIEAQRGIRGLHERHPDLLKMEFGIGINSGTAMAGSMGSRDRTEYSVIGDTVNVAFRITAATPAGRVWIGERSLDAVKDDISVRPLNALDVKGKDEPVKVWEVAELIAESGSPDISIAFPLVSATKKLPEEM